jgi:tetratricopeptide (TPR) repeat protein
VLGEQYDQLLLGVRTEVVNAYRIGKPFEAREKMREYLEEVNFDAVAVETMAVILNQFRLFGDLSRVLAPMVPKEKQTVTTRRLIGLANLSVGFQTGFAILDRTIEVAPDPAHEAAQIADALLARRLYEPALRYAKASVQRRPNRPEGRLVRGLARIGTGDLSGANEDLEDALRAGLNRNLAIQRAAIIALRNGHRAFAYDKLDALLVAHHNDFTRPGDAVRLVLTAFNRAGRGEEGVKFLESRRPSVAAMDGISGGMFISTLSQLYEEAGNNERAYEVYEAGLRRQKFTAPFADDLATYSNNLAYTFSTTDAHIDEGLNLIRSAIAHAPRRDASHIDTLGWLYYREGDLERAERELRRAIRSSGGSPFELEELYRHLAKIRALRGYHEDSVWLTIFADSVGYTGD